MNILVLNWQDLTNPHSGGAETHLHEIFSRIAARGHSVTLYCCSYKGAQPEELIDGIRIIREGHRNIFNAYVPYRYYTRFRHEGYDVVVDDINKIPFFTPLYVDKPLLAIAHHLFGTSIFAEVGRIAGSYVYAAERLLRTVYHKTEFVVVSPSTQAEFIEMGFRQQQCSIIYNCIDRQRFPFALQAKSEQPTALYIGRLKRYKSVHHILEAFRIVLNTLPDAQLYIAGKGDDEGRLKALAVSLGISQNTHFVGFVSEAEKAQLLSRAHCFVNPSMKEGWGIVNIEANACGTPVVSADSPGLRDSVRDNESGLLYQYGNIAQLAERLTSVLSNEHLRVSLSKGALAFAQQFDWDLAAEQMIQRLQDVIDSRAQLSSLQPVSSFTPSISPAEAVSVGST